MNITDEEKEELFREFKERMISEGTVNKSISYKNQHNLEKAREHFGKRVTNIKTKFDHYIWSQYGINWPDWQLIIRLICHTYGVSTVGRLPDTILEDANNLAINLIDTIFNANEKTLTLSSQILYGNKNSELEGR